MRTDYCLFYKTNHTDTKTELIFCENWQAAQDEAARMIEQFKYWGGGPVPVSASANKWTAAGKYAGIEFEPIYYPENLYLEYARENSNKYGYYKDIQRIQAARAAA
jgi:hypothetical protein